MPLEKKGVRRRNREVGLGRRRLRGGWNAARKEGCEATKSGGGTRATEIAWGLECRRRRALSRQRTTSCVNDRQLRADG